MFYFAVENEKRERLELSGNSGYCIDRIDGLSELKSVINMSEYSGQDGAIVANKNQGGFVYNSVRDDVRNLGIYITIKGDVEGNRINLYKYFTRKKRVKIFFKNGTRNVYIESFVEDFTADLFGLPQSVQIVLLCPQPYFKSVSELIVNFSNIFATFKFPFSNEIDPDKLNYPRNHIQFSQILADVRQTVVNSGDVETGVIFSVYFSDNVKNPVLYCADTGGTIRLNYNFIKSDRLIINTNINQKKVELTRNTVVTNLINFVGKNPEWFVLKVGDNVFSFNSDDGTDNIIMTIFHNNLFVGV